MKLLNRFLMLTVMVMMMITVGCYQAGEPAEGDDSLYDIFGDGAARPADTGDEGAEVDEDESPLARLLREQQAAQDEQDDGADDTPAQVDESPTTTPTTPTTDSSLPRKIVKEGDMVSFAALPEFDADGDELTYTFTSPIGRDGEWQTEVGDAGEYEITITADDGFAQTSAKLLLVVESLNRPPVIQIDDITVSEGDTVSLSPVVTDPDGDDVEVTYSGWMTSSTKTTSFGDAGEHTVRVTASDGVTSVTRNIVVTVEKVNRAPVLSSISDVVVTEGDLVSVRAQATDPDGDAVTITYGTPLDQDGEWQTVVGDAGSYNARIVASDGELEDSQTVRIVVESANRPPVLQVSDVLVNVGDTVRLDVEVSDPDGDDVEVIYTGWMTTTSKVATEAGVFNVTVIASDGIAETRRTVTVTVNTPPEIDLSIFT